MADNLRFCAAVLSIVVAATGGCNSQAQPQTAAAPTKKTAKQAAPKKQQTPVAVNPPPPSPAPAPKKKRSKASPPSAAVATDEVSPPAEAAPAQAKAKQPAKTGQTAKTSKLSPAERDALLTRENYDKVQPGMARDEVLTVLGPYASSAGSGKDWKYVWRPRGTKGQEIEVHLHDGLVTTKKSTMPWAAEAKATLAETAAADPPKDKLDRIIDDLKSRDNKKIREALHYLRDAPLDEQRAPEISKLIERQLATKDFFLTSAAAPAIKRWATTENVPYFLKVLNRRVDTRDATDDNRDQQPLAMEVLARLREPQAVAPIAKILTHFFDRKDAKAALLAMGPELAEDEVLKYANHKDANVALVAREILAEFKTGAGKRLDQCLTDLQSTNADRRLWAAQTIGGLPVDAARRKEVALALEKLLPDEYGWPAHAAAQALGSWGIPQNEPALIEALKHKSPDMRRLAAAALAKVGTKQSLPALQKVAGGEKLSPNTAKAAEDAIAAITARKK